MPDVFEAAGPPLIVDVEVTVPVSAALVFDTRPVVMTTGMYITSLGAASQCLFQEICLVASERFGANCGYGVTERPVKVAGAVLGGFSILHV